MRLAELERELCAGGGMGAEIDGLRAIVNVAMGQAADSLARLFNALRVTADGRVTTSEGHAYLGPVRRPLSISPDTTDVSISADGVLNVNGEPST
ncbi:MAG TPA: hypothetical protein VK524_26925 [Polyangiaceae bacterium]|nr:hypothetical protein [Polyangiaceae bacterium]